MSFAPLIHSLPNELLDAIFRRVPHASLLSLASTSRRLAPCAMRRIYRSISLGWHLTCPQSSTSTAAAVGSSAQRNRALSETEKALRCLQVLVRNTPADRHPKTNLQDEANHAFWLASLVRDFSIVLYGDNVDHSYQHCPHSVAHSSLVVDSDCQPQSDSFSSCVNIVFTLLSEVLSKTTGLIRLSVHTHFDSTLYSPVTFFPKVSHQYAALTSFSCSLSPSHHSQLNAFLWNCPNLLELDLSSPRVNRRKPQPVFPNLYLPVTRDPSDETRPISAKCSIEKDQPHSSVRLLPTLSATLAPNFCGISEFDYPIEAISAERVTFPTSKSGFLPHLTTFTGSVYDASLIVPTRPVYAIYLPSADFVFPSSTGPNAVSNELALSRLALSTAPTGVLQMDIVVSSGVKSGSNSKQARSKPQKHFDAPAFLHELCRWLPTLQHLRATPSTPVYIRPRNTSESDLCTQIYNAMEGFHSLEDFELCGIHWTAPVPRRMYGCRDGAVGHQKVTNHEEIAGPSLVKEASEPLSM